MSTVSMFSVAPEATNASGTALCPEPAKLAAFARSDNEGLQALARAASPEFPDWLRHVRAAADCAKPLRLAGRVTTYHGTGAGTATDPVTYSQSIMDTAHMPDGAIYKRCGNRRSGVCPSCSKIYQRDAYQIVRAGIIGGKGIPATVANQPSIFATFTAPSFGAVHRRVVKTHTCQGRHRCDCRAEPCHPNRTLPTCEHGNNAFCYARHEANDRRIGKPVCLDCYDYDSHVVWNKFAGELWRRTKQAIDRELAKLCKDRGIAPVCVGVDGRGRPVCKAAAKASCGKAAEFQARAAVHFHALVRLDGRHPDDPAAIVAPPQSLSGQDLDDAIRAAATSIVFRTPPHPLKPEGWLIAWGEQLDTKAVELSGEGEVTDSQVAGYIAKYATKSTEITGHTSSRITENNIDWYSDQSGSHAKRLVAACWRLGAPTLTPDRAAQLVRFLKTPALTGRTAPHPGAARVRRCPRCRFRHNSTRCRVCDAKRYRTADTVAQQLFLLLLLLASAGQLAQEKLDPYAGLRRWAHMLGFGGHFFSQSPYYSVRFRILREARITFRRKETTPPDSAESDEDPDAEETVIVVRSLSFAGTGWHTTADAQLATTSAALAREHQTRARQMLAAIQI